MTVWLTQLCGCSWRDPFLSCSTWVSEEGRLTGDGERKERRERQYQTALKGRVSCSLLRDSGRRSTHWTSGRALLEGPLLGPWGPPKPSAKSTPIPTPCQLLCTTLSVSAELLQEKLQA